jgi:peptidoglycan-N-acetylglucosamine deacetylase
LTTVFLLFIAQSNFFLDFFQTGNVRYRYHTAGHKDIVLTIDDGPCPNSTLYILNILKKYSVKATWFIVGNSAQHHKYLMNFLVADGQDIQNHDYLNHATIINYLKSKDAVNDIRKTTDILKQFVSQRSLKYFRPGYGFYYSSLLSALSQYKFVLGNIYPFDTFTGYGPIGRFFLYNYISLRTSPGSIIILHDKNTLNNAEVLDRLIPKLQGSGYTFRTISEMEEKYPDS